MTAGRLGYRHWHGERTGRVARVSAIARVGVTVAWRSVWLRRIVYTAWLPVLWWGAGFLAFESVDVVGGIVAGGSDAARTFFEQITESLRDGRALPRDANDARHLVWSFLSLQFFSSTQSFFLFLIVGQVAPPLISRDLATRAHLLYFSRPIDRVQYVLGKAATIGVYIVAVTTLPSLGLYVVALLAASDWSALLATWDIPLRILTSSVLVVLPMASLSLAMSAATRRPRFAQAGWFAVWIGGWMLYGAARAGEVTNGSGGSGSAAHLLSFFHTLRRAQSSVFGLPEGPSGAAFLLLAAITVVSLAFVARRVHAPIRE
jgi:hypothetical protein